MSEGGVNYEQDWVSSDTAVSVGDMCDHMHIMELSPPV